MQIDLRVSRDGFAFFLGNEFSVCHASLFMIVNHFVYIIVAVCTVGFVILLLLCYPYSELSYYSTSRLQHCSKAKDWVISESPTAIKRSTRTDVLPYALPFLLNCSSSSACNSASICAPREGSLPCLIAGARGSFFISSIS